MKHGQAVENRQPLDSAAGGDDISRQTVERVQYTAAQRLGRVQDHLVGRVEEGGWDVRVVALHR